MSLAINRQFPLLNKNFLLRNSAVGPLHACVREREKAIAPFLCMHVGAAIRERNVAQQAIQPTDQEILVDSSSGAALHALKRES